MIDAGAHVDITDNDGRTALSCAAENGYKETVEAFIGAGAEVDRADSDGKTALMYAP